MNKKRLDKFLKELTKLTQKYEFQIAGCGCCGSPFIIDLTSKGESYYLDGDEYMDGNINDLTYKNGEYTVTITPPYKLPKINPKALINLGRR